MATLHATRFQRNSFRLLLREMGEPLTYYADGGVSGRPIDGIVERNVEVPSGNGDVAQALIIRVLDSLTEGIAASEIDDGQDDISVPLKAGGTAERRRISRFIDDANGVVRFMVR
jgi:hypothetical protein